MNEIIEKLEAPLVNESYGDYKLRMEGIHGSEIPVPAAIKRKYIQETNK